MKLSQTIHHNKTIIYCIMKIMTSAAGGFFPPLRGIRENVQPFIPCDF